MKKYELMSIINQSLGEDKARDLSNKIRDEISGLGGKIINSNFMGKKKFAYEIKHNTEGYYDSIEFELEPKSVEELKAKLNYFDGLTRYLVTAE